jgi:uncharacterized membrane protein YphA (DoxX/SURF4 family)
MNILFLVARLLLGLVFVVFGANGFLHFIHMPPPTGLALQYESALGASHIMVFVFTLQLLGGLLLLIGRYVPLALTLLGPVIVNILLFHVFMAPQGLPLPLFVTLLWLICFWGVRGAFAAIFAPTYAEHA